MSGHSKWNNIKNKKAKTDAQKGKIFTKIGKEIAIAVREGGPDPASNSKLKDNNKQYQSPFSHLSTYSLIHHRINTLCQALHWALRI